MWLIAEDLKWGPEWDMWEYFGYRADIDPPYDNMGTHLCFGEYPDQKWRSNWLNRQACSPKVPLYARYFLFRFCRLLRSLCFPVAGTAQ